MPAQPSGLPAAVAGTDLHIVDPAAWLPLARKEPILTKSFSIPFIKGRKDRDWFLKLAWALNDAEGYAQANAMQGRMLAKLYLFMRDYMPKGLRGPFAHISGADVMDHFLSDVHTASQHIVAMDAEAAFSALREWMKVGRDWREALENTQGCRALGLCPPAGMLALLAIKHPDRKDMALIGSLQITWMLTQPRSALAVPEGYWQGITASNTHTVFLPETAQQAKTAQLADYHRLLGVDFVRCRKNRRPFPGWASALRLILAPSDVEESSGQDDEDFSGPGRNPAQKK
ncbi:hypothetical protein FJTKL_11182 [Diaporthe vaccinii]|uniref:Uncharacterized protein n=1 Tax=Diaporthe vaccinii TaxID=105482 RepID=A0ABR4EI61_9PEZI